MIHPMEAAPGAFGAQLELAIRGSRTRIENEKIYATSSCKMR